MNERAAKERPVLITLVCLLGFLAVASGLLRINSTFNKGLGATFQAYYVVVLLISLVAYVGMWRMKKWGVILFSVITVIHLGVSLQVIHLKFITLLLGVAFSAAFIALLFYFYPRMD